MADVRHRSIIARGAALFRNGAFVKGMTGLGVPGVSAPEVDVSSIVSQAREFVLDIPDPGTASFGLIYNPADPVHKAMYADLATGKIASYEWIAAGMKINGVNTKTGDEIGTVKITTMAVADGQGTTSSYTYTGEEPQEGDILKDQTGSSPEDLMVVSKDISVEGAVNLICTKIDGTAPTAVSAARNYKTIAPALVADFQGRVQSFPVGTQSSGDALRIDVGIRITGALEWKVGMPNVA